MQEKQTKQEEIKRKKLERERKRKEKASDKKRKRGKETRGEGDNDTECPPYVGLISMTTLKVYSGLGVMGVGGGGMSTAFS